MALIWSEKLSVGNARIDQQHQELFRRFDQLLNACNQRRGKDEITPVLEFLNQYVQTHFQDEERQMAGHGYPEFEQHQAEHRYFSGELKKLSAQLQQSGPSTELVITTNQTLLAWIVKHIQNVDVRLGAFLKDKSPT